MNAPDLFAQVPVAAPHNEGYVLCEFDGVTLAIQHSDIVTIEHGSELMVRMPGESALGWFEGAHGPWPVYGLNAQLELLETLPLDRSFLAFLKTDNAPFGLLCDNVRIASRRDEMPACSLPSVMLDEHGPIRAVSRIDSRRIALITTERGIARHIERLSEQTSTGEQL
jgi:hypothetical protein